MDPNWFYSTLAQSTAAIVGLIGAFLVARLLAQREEVGELRETLRNRCKALLRDIDGERQTATAVVDSMRGIAGRLEEGVRAQQPDVEIPNPQPVKLLTPPQYGTYSTAGMVGRLSTGNLDAIENARDAAARYAASLPADFPILVEMLRVDGALRPPPGAEWLEEDVGTVPGPDPQRSDQFFVWLPAQCESARARWKRLTSSAADAADHLRNFRARLLPRSLYVLLAILTALLGASLIAPLFFLSAKSDASRPILLGAFAVLASALLGYFGYELRRLRRADRLAPDTF